MKLGLQEGPRSVAVEPGLCVFNGIDGETGDYLLPPLSLRQIADLARREPRYHLPRSPRSRPRKGGPQDKGPAEGIDARDLGQTGWGVVFARSVTREQREALSPLLAHRQEHANAAKREGRYRELEYRPGESKTGFLARHGVPSGPADPDRLPYYLLLVGDPEAIPFEFQYQLDVQYAVGRIHFETPEEYERYARSVVEAETRELSRRPVAAFFAPRNANDPPTALSADHLATPLATMLAGQLPGWATATALGEEATKGRLQSWLEGDEPPALLFTAGHGLCYPCGHEKQMPLQGSLVCQDWPGRGHRAGVEHCFGADDLSDNARVVGMIAFHFSCFGAGTPQNDVFPEPLYGQRRIAPRAFLSRLSQRLLTHPGGGALAVVGHVDRAWGWSFSDIPGLDHAFRPVFESTLKRLTRGFPLGYAMEYFNSCYAELSTDLDGELRRSGRGRDPKVAELWTRRNDARNYAVLGDPAVRLAVPAQKEVP